MKEVKFKIIELPTHQILLMKDWDENDDEPIISVAFFLEGIKVIQSFGYHNEQARDDMFDQINEELAEKILNGAIQLFNDSKPQQ